MPTTTETSETITGPDGREYIKRPMVPPMRIAAQFYAGHGIPVFPIFSTDGARCDCGKSDCKDQGKHPLTRNGFKDATTDLGKITTWWNEHPLANIGMPTGQQTKILVLDTDPRNGGPVDRAELIERCGPMPETAEAETGGGGRHYFLRYPGGKVPPNIGPGLDLKGDGGYVLLAPSLHKSGKRYTWDGIEGVKSILHPADAPAWLLERIKATSRNGMPAAPPPEGKIPKGQRHMWLVKLAGGMRNQGAEFAEIFEALKVANSTRCSGTEAEVRQIVESIVKYPPGKVYLGPEEPEPTALKKAKKGGPVVSPTPQRCAVEPSSAPFSDEERSEMQTVVLPTSSQVSEGDQAGAHGGADGDRDHHQPEVSVPSGNAWPEPLDEAAYYGLAGRIVRAIEPHSEADPAAILIQLLVAFGNVIGRAGHFTAEADKHFTNMFAVLVGRTAKSRKGTSWGQVRERFQGVDANWLQDRVMGGLSTGEGLAYQVRDAYKDDAGVTDKRLMIVEPEFARVLAVCEREGATLSAVLRQAWDTGTLRTLPKKDAVRAHNAHIALIAHITKDELRRMLTDTAAANGFANRFLWICCRRSKLLPEGGKLSAGEMAGLDADLVAAVRFARAIAEVRRDAGARDIWINVYPALSEGQPGLLGAITSRAEAQTMRLALLYALLDHSSVIRSEHLLAGLAMWSYAERSARFIFGDALGDQTADEIIRALRSAGVVGMTRAEIREFFGRHKPSAEIARALGVLLEYGMARFEKIQTDGRPAERWFSEASYGAR